MACTPFDCNACGQRHDRCADHSIRCPDPSCDWSGKNTWPGKPCVKCGTPTIIRPCRKWPYAHLEKCAAHGSGNQVSREKSDRLIMEEKTERSMQRILSIEGYESITDPYTELAMLAGEVLKVKDVFRDKVEELTNLKDAGGERVATQIDVLVSAYERALDRSERLLLGISRLDLDARIAALHAKIDASTAELVSSAMYDALGESALTQEDRESIMQAFGRYLRKPRNMPASLSA